MFDVEFYETADGKVPMEEFLDSLPVKMRGKSIHSINLLCEFGNTLREPYSKYIGDDIFELRVKFASDITRVFYFFSHEEKIILTHGFIKKSMKLPGCEKKKAVKCRQDYLNRQEG